MSDPNKSEPHPLAPMMERARQEPFFLGFVLNEQAHRLGWDDARLAEQLQCPLARLPQLFLCRCPDPADSRFAQDVRTIAEYAPCDELQLLQLLREHSALAKLSKTDSPPNVNPLLLAARDRQDAGRDPGQNDPESSPGGDSLP